MGRGFGLGSRSFTRSVAEDPANDVFNQSAEETLGTLLPPVTKSIGAEGFRDDRSKTKPLAPFLEIPFHVGAFFF